MVIRIKTYKITSNSCPFQVECETYDGKAVYIRSRHDYFYVAIGNNINEAVGGKEILNKNYEIYSMKELIKETKGVLDFGEATKLNSLNI